MRLEHWLFGALTVASLACGSDPDFGSTGGNVMEDDDDDSSSSGPDAGKKDAGKDAGKDAKGSAPVTSDDDDGDDDKVDPNANVCDSVSIQARPNAPEILIVLDRSGSMIAGNRWVPSANAVKKLTTELDESVSWGLMMFPAVGSMGGLGIPGLDFIPGLGMGTACQAGKVDVPVKLSNASKIATALDRGAPDPLGSTPTAATLDAAYGVLTADTCADCATKEKYVLLVTDGQPTCGAGGTQSTPEDVTASTTALKKLVDSGIKTYVVGYDMAKDANSAAVMEQFAQAGGTDKYIPVESETDLVEEIRRIAGALVSCEYELNEEVEDPKLVRVIIDKQERVLGEGWELNGRKVILHEGDGGACTVIKDARVHNVQIRKECESRSFQ